MIAVLGAGGQLGSALVERLGSRCAPITRSQVDLRSPQQIRDWLADADPPVVINCAGYTAVDAAESDPQTAEAVNTTAVEVLAEETARLGSRFVTFSTDYVFDGTKGDPYLESDPTGPLSVYGRTKLEGEKLAIRANPEALIVRTSWVLSGTHQNFATTMLRLARSGGARVVNDQVGRPTFVTDLAQGTLSCLEAGVTGLIHLTNGGEATWFELARQVAQLAGLDPSAIEPCTTAEYPTPAPRPANSRLDSERLGSYRIPALPQYGDSLPAVVDSLLARGF